MTNRVARGRGARVAHLEFLEERALLSAAVVSHPPAEVAAVSASTTAPKVLVLHGTIGGVAAASSRYPGFNTGITGKGNVGGSRLAISVVGYQNSALNGATATVTNGIAVFTFTPLAPTTSLRVAYSGGGQQSKSAPTQTLTFSGKILGGSGAFPGVTGTFSATVAINAKTGAFTMNYTLNVTLKG